MRFSLRSRRVRPARRTHPARRKPHLESLEPRAMMAADGSASIVNAAVRVTEAAADPTSNEQFVEWISTALVDQPLSDKAQAFLLRRIDHGGSRRLAVAYVVRSLSSRRAEIKNTYDLLLHRAPTQRELNQYLARGGVDQLVVIRNVLQSPEYFMARGGGTNEGFVEALAADMLGRPAADAEASAWLAQLNRGVPRSRFVASFLSNPATIHRAAERIAWHASSGDPDPALVDQIIASWHGPSPMTAAKAIAFGSQQFLDRFPENPVVDPSTSTPALNGNGITPQFSLNTVWQNVPVDAFSLQAVGASPQGKAWIGTSGSLSIEDLSSLTLTTAWSGFVHAVAPISDTEAWFIGDDSSSGLPVVMKITSGNAPVVAASLPSSDTPVQIAASTDGLDWVLGQSGTVYAYQSGTNTWETISNDGFTIKQISIGSATNIWAIGELQGAPVVLQWTSGAGWSHDTFFDGTSPNAVAAAADGSVWVANTVLGPEVFLRRPGGTWGAPVPHQTPPAAVGSLAAFDENRAIAIVASITAPVSVLSVGIVDRPAVAFPTLTDQWDAAYQGITDYFDLGSLSNGIRSTYSIGTSNFDYYVDQLTVHNGETAMPRPEGVDPDNWVIIADQIVEELLDAEAVQSLFNQLILINDAFAKVSKESLNTAVNYVGLTNDEQQSTPVVLGIGTLFEAAIAGVATLFSGGAATVAAVFNAYADAEIASLTGQSSPNPDTTLTATYAKLYTDMTNFYDNTGATYASDLTTITTDYGMLSAVGSIVRSFVWYVVDGSQETYSNAAKPSIELKYFQDLTRVKWQVIEVRHRLCTIDVCPQVNAPDYDRYDQVLQQNSDGLLENIFFAHQLGSSTNPFHDPGPYPSQTFLDYLFNPPVPPPNTNQTPGLGVSRSDFFEGKNGWNLSKVIVPG